MAFVSFNKFKILNMLNKTVVGGISSFLTSEFLFFYFFSQPFDHMSRDDL